MKLILSRLLLPFSVACTCLSVTLVLLTYANARSVLQEYRAKNPSKNAPSFIFSVSQNVAQQMPLFFPGAFLFGASTGWFYSMLEAPKNVATETLIHTAYVLPLGIGFLVFAILLPVLFPSLGSLTRR